VRSFQSLLTHLATLTRNDIRYGTDPHLPTVPTLTAATTTQRRAFELLHATIPLTLTQPEQPLHKNVNPPLSSESTRYQSRNFGLGFRLPCCGR